VRRASIATRSRAEMTTARTMANPNPEQPVRSHSWPYKIQHEFERAWCRRGLLYLRENGLGLFHLGALGCLLLCVSSVCVIPAPKATSFKFKFRSNRLIAHEKLLSSLQGPASRGLQIPATSSSRHLLGRTAGPSSSSRSSRF